MSIVRGGGESYANVAMLVGHMARKARDDSFQEAGAELQDALEKKDAARQAVKEAKADHQFHLKEVKAAADDQGFFGDISPFETRLKREQIRVQNSAVSVEKSNVVLSERAESVEQIQKDVKDVHEEFDASQKVFQNIFSEAELSRTR